MASLTCSCPSGLSMQEAATTWETGDGQGGLGTGARPPIRLGFLLFVPIIPALQQERPEFSPP